MKPVTLAAFNSREEAEPLLQWLLAAGIQAEVQSEAGPEPTFEFSRPSAGVRIAVPRDDFEAALRLVYDWNLREPAHRPASTDAGAGPEPTDRPQPRPTD